MKSDEISNMQKAYEDQIKQMEKNLEIVANEYEKVTMQHKQKSEELDQYKIKYSKLEVKYNQEIPQLITEVERMTSERAEIEAQYKGIDKDNVTDPNQFRMKTMIS
jgi:predicted  nucleic acid-binding Zn-ribbon protein